MTDVLVLCAANMCRSPMAAALLARELAARDADVLDTGVTVRSAGLLAEGEPPAPLAVAAVADLGLDISGHRSRLLQAADLAGAGLVLAMARAQLRAAVVLAPEVWPRAFTLKELVRRGEQAGPRPPGVSLGDWLARAHEGRDRSALLGDSADDDVADPIGGPPQAFARDRRPAQRPDQPPRRLVLAAAAAGRPPDRT